MSGGSDPIVAISDTLAVAICSPAIVRIIRVSAGSSLKASDAALNRESLMVDVTNFPANDPKYTVDKSHAGNIIIKTGALSVQIDMASEQALLYLSMGQLFSRKRLTSLRLPTIQLWAKTTTHMPPFKAGSVAMGRCTEEVSFRMGF